MIAGRPLLNAAHGPPENCNDLCWPIKSVCIHYLYELGKHLGQRKWVNTNSTITQPASSCQHLHSTGYGFRVGGR
uniref:Uncharacterized protein n=1 Tax=Glossina palpalis gambiensis TaxID=67801 RepID=A0A1B0C792_9MUSC